jgi:hypothetical protein
MQHGPRPLEKAESTKQVFYLALFGRAKLPFQRRHFARWGDAQSREEFEV